ncbi:mechanosensitive ion channel family protein [Avrilella dinanensis]|uniref:mechanosensitive ion channel family protein n=1 Tax=Avrilella dinanensis TaxID=2008672 RepID=UPI00240925BB|nr:mechanosensitive ion channel [Avrilella dinanensis]
MEELYQEHLANSTSTINEWLIKLKDFAWDCLLLLVYLIVCYFLFKILVLFAKKIIKLSKIEKLDHMYEKIDFLRKNNIQIKVGNIILVLFKAFLFLIFVIIGADLFGMNGVTNMVNELLAYLPKLASGVLIILAGVFIANWIKQKMTTALSFVENTSATNVLINVIVTGLILFFVLMGLNQAGIDTTLITSNISVIIGGFVAAIALAFGLGAKGVVKEIMFAYYLRKNLSSDRKVRITSENIEGNVISIDNINAKIKKTDGTVVMIPIKKLVDSNIEFLD